MDGWESGPCPALLGAIDPTTVESARQVGGADHGVLLPLELWPAPGS